MNELPDTPLSLIARIQQQGDGPVWKEFLEIYGPVVVGFVRAKGLQDADVRDVTQEAFQAVVQAIPRFDRHREKGRFRNWLFVIVRSKLADHWRRAKRELRGSGDPEVGRTMEDITDQSDQSLWDREYKQRLLNWAADQIRGRFSESTWEAFRMTCVEGRSAQDVAAALEMTVSDVYVRKSRVLARLREKVRQAEGD